MVASLAVYKRSVKKLPGSGAGRQKKSLFFKETKSWNTDFRCTASATSPRRICSGRLSVAEIGYKYIEFAGFFGNSAEDVKAALDANGLVCSGTHTGLGELDADFAAAVKYHHTIGNKNFIIPWADTSTKEKLDALIDGINKYQPMLAAEGITLAFHNHSGEFLPNQDGQIPHEEMQKRTKIDFEIDTCWAYVAGRDPVETITALKDRVHMIHLKDIKKTAEGKHEGRALGEGEAPSPLSTRARRNSA